MSRGGNIRGVVHLQNQNYLGKESLKCSSKSNEWPKNPNDSQNYHDENHKEIENVSVACIYDPAIEILLGPPETCQWNTVPRH